MVAILGGCGSPTASTAPTANEAEIASVKLARVEWDNAWKGRCLRHRLDWLAPGVESDLLDDFGQKLDPRAYPRYDRLNDIPKFCGADERWGQSCDVNVKRRALHKMGLLADFAEFACDRMICIGQSDCHKP
jgi:hypothetical protein